MTNPEDPDEFTKALADAMRPPAAEPQFVASQANPDCEGGVQPGGQPVDIWEVRRHIQAQWSPRYRIPLPPRVGRLVPSRGNTRCGRCARPWWAVRKSHTTWYSSTPEGMGMQGIFPLCHRCWTSLRTPDRRLPYYRAVFDRWVEQAPYDHDETDWLPIARSVREGL